MEISPPLTTNNRWNSQSFEMNDAWKTVNHSIPGITEYFRQNFQMFLACNTYRYHPYFRLVKPWLKPFYHMLFQLEYLSNIQVSKIILKKIILQPVLVTKGSKWRLIWEELREKMCHITHMTARKFQARVHLHLCDCLQLHPYGNKWLLVVYCCKHATCNGAA